MAFGIVLVGCGGGHKQTTTTTTTTTPPPPTTTTIRIYFLRHGRLQPVLRQVPKTTKVVDAALSALFGRPSKDEAELGLSTAIPSITMTFAPAGGDIVRLKTDRLPRAALAQVVYTLTQFPSSRTVEVNGRRYTRADFEDETPIILVESPLPFQRVTSPLHATGTANTFEATFQYDLVDPDGKLIKTHFVTATSGTGTRGTFDFSVPFTVSRDGLGKLVVYELSAADGSRIHQIEIPIRMTRPWCGLSKRFTRNSDRCLSGRTSRFDVGRFAAGSFLLGAWLRYAEGPQSGPGAPQIHFRCKVVRRRTRRRRSRESRPWTWLRGARRGWSSLRPR